MNPCYEYLREIKRTGHIATWLPNTIIEIGDVGLVRNGVFRRIGHLPDEIDFEITDVGAPIDFVHQTDGAVTVSASIDAEAQLAGLSSSGQLTVEFHRKHAVAAYFSGCQSQQVADMAPIFEYVTSRIADKTWSASKVVVTGVIRCRSLRVLIGGGKNSRVDFAVSGVHDLPDFRLTSVKSNAAVIAERQMATHISGDDLTPFYAAIGVQRSVPFVGRMRPVMRSSDHDKKSNDVSPASVKLITLDDVLSDFDVAEEDRP